MSLFTSINASSTGLTAQRSRMDVIANNIANVDTPNYRRQLVIFRPKGEEGFIFNVPMAKASIGVHQMGEGVIIEKIKDDDRTPMRTAYMPGHPDADAQGYVSMPNVNLSNEMVDMIYVSKLYDANITAFNATRKMMQDTLTMQ